MEIKEKTTLWKELNEIIVTVPDYQRDYAQGRKDNGRIDDIRRNFVHDLLSACCTNTIDKSCHLGLVYGAYKPDSIEFTAVDGQQRLTTVFLLHWFLIWRSDKLSDFFSVLQT